LLSWPNRLPVAYSPLWSNYLTFPLRLRSSRSHRKLKS
jgi:hypothetical protein